MEDEGEECVGVDSRERGGQCLRSREDMYSKFGSVLSLGDSPPPSIPSHPMGRRGCIRGSSAF